MQALVDGFMKKYPFIKASPVRVSGAGIITRVESEARAGKASSDVVDSGRRYNAIGNQYREIFPGAR